MWRQSLVVIDQANRTRRVHGRGGSMVGMLHYFHRNDLHVCKAGDYLDKLPDNKRMCGSQGYQLLSLFSPLKHCRGIPLPVLAGFQAQRGRAFWLSDVQMVCARTLVIKDRKGEGNSCIHRLFAYQNSIFPRGRPLNPSRYRTKLLRSTDLFSG
ncbi:hypothetical protein GOP47_0017457 [Adiantum capillus-veneris]|uniref:Uncharacterized protein n=1 Tax=Adiantum capillus-veneris TaxID=13818 RepID=A0A9D4UGF2_ADICA|nr:hypothetical protein GOP47_0017457 [Adiantum capillus-veneris]